MKLVSKLDKPPPRPALEALGEVYRRRSDRQARVAKLTAIILKLEAADAVATEPGAAVIARREARSIMRQSPASDDFDGLSTGETLFEARRERDQIIKDIERSDVEILRAENDRADEIREQHRERHAQHVQRVAHLLIALRDEHRGWEQSKADIAEQEGMHVYFAADPTEDLFFQTDFDRQYQPVVNFFEDAVRAGLLAKDPR